MQTALKLKAAMKEIESVMDKYDVGGHVILHSPDGESEGMQHGISEFLFKLSPTYSCAVIEELPDGASVINLKSSSKHYNGDKGIAQKITGNTINMFVHIRDRSADAFKVMHQTLEHAKTIMDIDEGPMERID